MSSKIKAPTVRTIAGASAARSEAEKVMVASPGKEAPTGRPVCSARSPPGGSPSGPWKGMLGAGAPPNGSLPWGLAKCGVGPGRWVGGPAGLKSAIESGGVPTLVRSVCSRRAINRSEAG